MQYKALYNKDYKAAFLTHLAVGHGSGRKSSGLVRRLGNRRRARQARSRAASLVPRGRGGRGGGARRHARGSMIPREIGSLFYNRLYMLAFISIFINVHVFVIKYQSIFEN